MNYLNVPYNQLTFKASHNTYQQTKYDFHQILSWDAKKPSDFGCRGVEIDFDRHSDSSNGRSLNYFEVTHSTSYAGPPLASYLGYLLSYHFNNPGHDPILVTLCIKSTVGSVNVFPQEMDNYIREWFYPPLLFSPARLLVRGDDLVTSIARRGWPKAKELRDRFVFCLSGTEKWKSYYSKHHPRERLCFADVDVPGKKPNPVIAATGTRIFANMELVAKDFKFWRVAVSELHERNFFVRGWDLNAAKVWDDARSAKVNAIATDRVYGHSWATVGPAPFAK